MLKEPLRHVPGLGWAIQNNCYLLISRSWNSDRAIFARYLDLFATAEHRTKLLIFPGTLPFPTVARPGPPARHPSQLPHNPYPRDSPDDSYSALRVRKSMCMKLRGLPMHCRGHRLRRRDAGEEQPVRRQERPAALLLLPAPAHHRLRVPPQEARGAAAPRRRLRRDRRLPGELPARRARNGARYVLVLVTYSYCRSTLQYSIFNVLYASSSVQYTVLYSYCQ